MATYGYRSSRRGYGSAVNLATLSTRKPMRAQVAGYWICTILIAFSFLSGGVVDLIRPSFALEGMAHLGYPAYFMLILGFWKVLGGGTILLPGFPLLKEWAYAGMIFDL